MSGQDGSSEAGFQAHSQFLPGLAGAGTGTGVGSSSGPSAGQIHGTFSDVGIAGSSSSSSSSRTRSVSDSFTPGTSLESIDGIANAIHSIAVSGGDSASQYKLVRESLLPALMALETRGTAAGVPGNMILQSALQGGLDPLNILMQQPNATGSGLGYLFIL